MTAYYAIRDYSYDATDDFALIATATGAEIPWLLGVPWPRRPLPPIEVQLSPEYGGETLPDIFLTGRSLLSPRALAVFTNLGVDNFDLYDAVVTTRDGRQIHDYKAFYPIGALACMDRVRSVFTELRPGRTSVDVLVVDGDATMGMPMFRLAEDPLWLLVAAELERALERAGITGVYYTPLEVV